MDVLFSGVTRIKYLGAANLIMAQAFITVEWFYMVFKIYWTTFDLKRNLQVGIDLIGLVYVSVSLFHTLETSCTPALCHGTLSAYYYRLLKSAWSRTTKQPSPCAQLSAYFAVCYVLFILSSI